MKSFFFFLNQTQPTATNKPESRHSKLDKFSKMSWFNYNWRKSILNFSNNCYHAVQVVFFLQAEKIPNMHYFSIYYFFSLFFLSIREHCHSTCSVWAWIEMTWEKLLPGLSPDTAVGKTQNEYFISPNQSSFHYLYSWTQQLQVTLQVMLSKMDKEFEDPLKFWRLVPTSVLPLSASQHCQTNAKLLQV